MVALDAATAVCGLLNAVYFTSYWQRRDGSKGRRIAAGVLVMVSVAGVMEALFSEGMFWSQHGSAWLNPLSPGIWALLRLPLFAATVSISITVLRKVLS